MKNIMIPIICMVILCSLLGAQAVHENQEALKPLLTQSDRLTDPAELAAFLDGMMAAYMTSHHIAGAAVAVVKNGEIFLSRGYGYADLEKKIAVDPETTLFRTGSVAKLITWTAVMQMVEQGKIDLDRDINVYLKDFKIPATFPQPITMKHLLTHSPGFEDFALGMVARTPADLSTLARTLREKLPARVFLPGETIAYSNYGAALAGYIVEQISGLAYETYVEENILKPLGMTRSTVRQPLPASLMPDMAVGYKFADGRYQPQGFELFKGLTPAGTMSATVNDMAKFMIAHLEQDRYRPGRILNEETMHIMHSRMFASDSRCSGMAGGFWEYQHNGLRLLEHGGDTFYFHTLLDLLPEKKVGIYIAYSGSDADNPGLDRAAWIRTFLDRYFPGTEPSAPGMLAGQKERLGKCAGYYWLSRSTLTTMEKLEILSSQIHIKAAADGRLIFRNKTWLEIEPLVFQECGGQDKIVFQQDKSGAIKQMIYSRMPPFLYLRAPWHLNPNLHLLVFLFCLLMFLSTLRWSLGALWRRICKKADSWSPTPAWKRWLMSGLGILNLAFILGFLLVLRDPLVIIYGVPAPLKILLALPLLALILALGTITLAVLAWVKKQGTICRRLYYSLLALAGLLFPWLLYYWNLLGYRF
jgi:CubicO group peptidase (beta-lactamase class C family)